MEKGELKKLKADFRSARLFGNDAAAKELEGKLRAELQAGWGPFEASVDDYVKKTQALADEVRAAVLDPKVSLVETAMEPYRRRAKDLGGGGAQKFINDAYAKAVAERTELRQKAKAMERPVVRDADRQPRPGAQVFKVKPARTLVKPFERGEVRPHAARHKDPHDNMRSAIARRQHKVQIKGRPVADASLPEMPANLGESCSSKAVRLLTAHRNDITSLKPSGDWVACIDESYLGEESNFVGDGPGIIAGVVFDKAHPLPVVEQLHCATDYDERKIRKADLALETILNHSNCGVLALPAQAQELSQGWEDLLSAWVDVLIRLLPYPEDDGQVTVTIMVEPRSGFEHVNQYAPLEFICMKSLKESFPERAKRTKISFVPLPKEDEVKSWNSYPDIVGHTCLRHQGCPTAKQRFMASGWNGTCFLNLHPLQVKKLLHCLYRADALDEESWRAILGYGTSGLVRGLAERFGERAKANRDEWLRYLEYLDRHLKSGSINMALLRNEIGWMERFIPSGLDPRPRLLWMTAKLALANHEGKLLTGIDKAKHDEFSKLCAQLFNEDAKLVCDAVLNLAVAYTNAYEFEMAIALIQSLLSRDQSTVGTSAYGKLLSTAGQHFAFLGMPAEALDHFDRAIACFETLSDSKERAVNIGITSAYRTTVVFDHRPAESRDALKKYLFGRTGVSQEEMESEVVRLATDRADKFKHHLLLRYVVSAERDDPIRKAYRSMRGRLCEPAAGHPWELIEFYRALLEIPGADRSAHLEKAWRLAIAEGGETVMVIAAVIAGSALVDDCDPRWPKRLAEALESVKDLAGLDDRGRRQALIDQPQAKLDPLELAAKVLPFNFR